MILQNIPEAIALLVSQIMEMARDGQHSVAELMDLGRSMLGRRQVLPGVGHVLDEVQIEATFRDGAKLVTLHHPVSRADGDLVLAFHGSYIPAPSMDMFKSLPNEDLIPGEVLPLSTPIVLNKNREISNLQVHNCSDRPIQVGSHYSFIETNPALEFDRKASYGKRLNIAAGTSVRFEPGETKVVALVPVAGNAVVRGGNDLCDGPINPASLDSVLSKVSQQGFKNKPKSSPTGGESASKRQKMDSGLELSRELYARMYGPTTGDVVRLADTDLYIRVEADHTVYGDECKFGGGKTLREGMGQATGLPTADQLDTVIINALIVDYTGIYKADIGIKDKRIAGIGKAGNPDIMDGVTPGMVVGVNTEVIVSSNAYVYTKCMQSNF